MIVRELLFGPKRFTDLRTDIPRVSANVLTQRLRALEKAGVVERLELRAPAAGRVYGLTLRGKSVEPILLALGRWGAHTSCAQTDDSFTAASLMLSMKVAFDPRRSPDVKVCAAFPFSRETLIARISRGVIEIVRGDEIDADLVFRGAPEAIAAAICGALPWHQQQATGLVRVLGSHASAARFLDAFPTYSTGCACAERAKRETLP